MTSAMATPPSEIVTVPSLVDHLFRRQAGQIVSTLTRILGAEHLDLVEDVVQEALLSALRRWPFEGIPERPAAWLQRVARNGALDRLRRDARLRALGPQAAALLHALPEPPLALAAEVADPAAAMPDEPSVFVDDQLRMMFMCAHPALSPDGRVTLMLRTVGGLGVNEIARAFLAEPAAVAQRIVRAKRRLKESGARLEMPDEKDLGLRLEAVLEVLSLIFNEGHLAHGGELLVRESLCADALRLARLLVRHHATARPEVHALCASFCFAAARLPARVSPEGELVTLEEQDRSSWIISLLSGGFRHLAEAAGGAHLTRYHLAAEIESCHAAARHANDTDWPRIVRAYDALSRIAPSPVVEVNRAVAVGRARGAAEGWRALEEIPNNEALAGYYPYHAARADALIRLGRASEAAESLRRALSLGPVEPARRFLARRLASVESA